MEYAASPKKASEMTGGYVSLVWIAFVFLLHLSVVYLVAHFCVAWLAGQIRSFLLPLLQVPPRESSFEFLFDHLAAISLLCGLVAGIITSQYRHRMAQLVWIVPSMILAYKFMAFPSTLFQNHFAVAFHHYFAGGFLIPEYHSYRDMFAAWSPEHVRGLDQMQFTAPGYVGVAYSLGGWVAIRLGLHFPDVESWVRRSRPVDADES